jgi:hypothetical protein
LRRRVVFPISREGFPVSAAIVDPVSAPFAPPTGEVVYRPDEVCAMLRISKKTLSKIRNRLRPVIIAKRIWRYRAEDVAHYLETSASAG